jgi:hypothetical protein
MLFRYHSPSARQTMDQRQWGYDYSSLSRIFNAMVDWVDTEHRSLYRNLPTVAHKFQAWNAKINGKLRTMFPHEALPLDAEWTAVFADGTRFEVSMPEGSWWK